MTKENEPVLFLNEIIQEIKQADSLHTKKLNKNLNQIFQTHKDQFDELLNLIYLYFSSLNITPEIIARDYLKMVNDMRKEGIYFQKFGIYSCKNQTIAYEKVYSQKEIMSYYMNALLISQILWVHHFNMFIYFKENLNYYLKNNSATKILDVGPGHGFFSYIIKNNIPDYKKLDIVDISESSLMVTKRIIGPGDDKINYFNVDIFHFESYYKYDLIILGEVLEHLDHPIDILNKLSILLTNTGVLWLTTPTNAPTLDHVYLFKSKEEVLELIRLSDLDVVDSYGCYAEDVDEEIARKNKVTQLIGAFCKRKVV